MARRGSSFTSAMYALARASATVRATRKGPDALLKRQVRRKVYRAEDRTARRILRKFGL